MDESGSMPLLYRTPQQPSLDGNTVETDTEMAQFMQNAMDYEASFQFLNSKFKGSNERDPRSKRVYNEYF